MFSPLYSPDSGGSAGGGGPNPDSRQPAQLRTMPLGEALDLVVREALRAQILSKHKGAPEFCTSSAVLELLWPATAKANIVKGDSGKLPVVVPAIALRQATGSRKQHGLVAEVLGSLAGFAGVSASDDGAADRAATAKSNSAKHAPFDYSAIDLNRLVAELSAASGKIERETFRFVFDAVHDSSLATVGDHLAFESSLPSLCQVTTYKAHLEAVRSFELAAGAAMWFAAGAGRNELHLTPAPQPFLEFVGRLYEGLKSAAPEFRNVGVVDGAAATQLIPAQYLGDIPEGVKLLCLPIRYGEIGHGGVVLAFMPAKAFDDIPPELKKELEWLCFKAGEATHLLAARLSAEKATEKAAERAAMAPPEVRVFSPEREFSAGGATCHRVMLRVKDEVAVVFISDARASGRSISNQFLELAQKSLPDISDTEIAKIRWYERRTGGRTGSGVQQSNCFQQVRIDFGTRQILGWLPADDDTAKLVSDALGFSLAEVDEL